MICKYPVANYDKFKYSKQKMYNECFTEKQFHNNYLSVNILFLLLDCLQEYFEYFSIVSDMDTTLKEE